MRFENGQRILHYQILEKIGEGGMGVVWKALDTTLDREVAIKVLPDAFSGDDERLARFEREAKLLASLNHPNIAAVYGLHAERGQRFLVMELIEGEDLASRLTRGPLPVGEALRVAVQVAYALEAAHRNGVVHRDLKPANVQLATDGKVKVLDFGLAKALTPEPPSADPALSPTMTSAGSVAGMILGTAAYMSPEQARGQTADRRCDVWALGALLYESLTGKRAFGGDTVTDVLASVVTHEPDWDALPPSTPALVEEVLRRCLRKNADTRVHDVADARIRIEEALADPDAATVATAADGAGGDVATLPRWRRALPWALTALLAATLLVVVSRQGENRGVERTTRLSVGLGPQLRLGDGGIAISPDGSRIVAPVVRGNETVLIERSLGRDEPVEIPGTEDASNPFFSPDGRWIGFTQVDKLVKLATDGGKPVPVVDADWGGGAWLADDTILYTPTYTDGLWRVPASGGAPQQLTRVDPSRELGHFWPQALPDGRHVLFTNFSTPRERARIEVLSLETGERKVLVEGGVFGRYVPTGHLVYVVSEVLMAVPFDPGRLEIDGVPVPVLEDVSEDIGEGDSQLAFSADGTLCYVTASALNVERSLLWVDREGVAEPVSDQLRRWRSPRLSPDGRRLALMLVDHDQDVWVYGIDRGTLTRLTFDSHNELAPAWTPKGDRVIFTLDSPPYDLYWTAADGSGSSEPLLKDERDKYAQSVSPDGSLLLYSSAGDESEDLWLLPLDGEQAPRPFLQTPFSEKNGDFSPDGSWVAYESNESGRNQVYVLPFPGPGAKYQVSLDGGTEPTWSRDGKELFYLNGDAMMAVTVDTRTGFEAGEPRVLFEGRYDRESTRNYDVAADGRFVMLQIPEASYPRTIRVVLHWFDELERLAGKP